MSQQWFLLKPYAVQPLCKTADTSSAFSSNVWLPNLHLNLNLNERQMKIWNWWLYFSRKKDFQHYYTEPKPNTTLSSSKRLPKNSISNTDQSFPISWTINPSFATVVYVCVCFQSPIFQNLCSKIPSSSNSRFPKFPMPDLTWDIWTAFNGLYCL